ncbi:MAG: DolP-mannose mannosyltransferase [Blastocatellia bacterium]
MSEMATVERTETLRQTIWKRLARFDRRLLFSIVFVVAALVYSQSQFWNQPSGGDRANWDYFAQVIARGGVPYRDVVNIKSPLSAYIGAAAIIITRPFGLRDILAIRITFILLAALTVAFTFLVALEYFKSLRVALLSATVMLTFDAFARFNAGGIQPKTPMVLFGLISLWAVIKDRPRAAGAFGMLSALTWQPGLLFAGAAGLAFTRYLTSWRDRKAVRLITWAITPLAVLLLYFWIAGALLSFYLWNVHFTATVYGPQEMRSLSNFFNQLSKLLNNTYLNSRVYFYLALAGLCVAIWQAVKRAGGGHLLRDAPSHAVMIAPVVYFAFCMIDIQSGPDLIPLVPFVAIFAAVAIAFVLDRAISLFARLRAGINQSALENWSSVAIIVFILAYNVSGAFFPERRFPTLQDQQPAIEELVSHLEPGDRIYVYGSTEILVLSGLTNADKYFLLDRGKARFLDKIEPGGFNGWFERLKAERPKIVALDRLGTDGELKPLEDWAKADYDLRINRVFAYYLRKDTAR